MVEAGGGRFLWGGGSVSFFAVFVVSGVSWRQVFWICPLLRVL